MTELQTIFEKINSDLFSEDVRQEISQLIESKINEKVEERLSLELDAVLKEQHEKFKNASIKALAKIDEDHTNKMKHLVSTIKENFGKKLLIVKEGYDEIIKKTALEHKDQLVENINEFIDINLEKAIPRQQIAESAKNDFVRKTLEEARKVLAVDETYIKENVKRAVVDGKIKMDKLIQENKQLKVAKIVEESKAFLARKTKNLPVNAAKFVIEQFQGKSLEFIQSNYDYVVEMYKRREKQSKRSALLNENHSTPVDHTTLANHLLTENTVPVPPTVNENPTTNFYLEGLQYRK